MSAAERVNADRVFRGTIDFNRIRVTNLLHGDPATPSAFCAPQNDGSFIIGVGDSGFDRDNVSKEFIHELAHAWQTIHARLQIERAFQTIIEKGFTDPPYPYLYPWPLDGRPWSGYSIEQQAQIVGDWYAIDGGPEGPAAAADERFGFIQNNIRARQP